MIAFDLIGYDGPDYIRVVGGRTLYESVHVNDGYSDGSVRLVRLDTTRGLRQINRYVDPDTLVEFVQR